MADSLASPCLTLLGKDPLTLTRGQALELFYRALVHSGLPDAVKLDGEFSAFTQAQPEAGFN